MKKIRKPMSRSRKAAWTRFYIAAFFAVLFVVFALYASTFARYDPLQTDYANMLKGPSSTYWFGTDQLGRDIYSRILYGGKTSLLIAFVVTGIVAAVGIFIGTAAGFIGGVFDSVLMRFCDMLMAFPGSIFTIALVSFIGTGIPNLILAMSLTSWTGFARISRSLVLSIKNNVFIEQARLGGASDWKILMVYIIPNVLPSLLVNIFQSIGGKLLTISGLSLLGLGSPPPTPEWGFMLSEGKNFMYQAPWMLMFPGLVILINVIIFNLLNDSIQELMNPKENNW
jgi:peptide/nickel transport system permease protein